ncbi:dTMP kinase [Microvirga sp. 2MCAF38]|uniref:dTMP kinase n=1 Tax=Microvirga sp. 2MCAF38 TaxID=3232989 RepID=UPI003F9C899D
MTGFFITFEGGEGAGKSTQIDRLRRRLEERGQSVIVTREPGGSPRAEEIRAFLLSGGAKPFGAFAEALLFYAARFDHLEHTIRPALMKGIHVLCDRFSDSTRAYQGASGNVDKHLIEGIERVVVGNNKPNLTLILDLPVEAGLRRADLRREGNGERVDRFEGEGLAFHERLRQAYLDIAANEPGRCVVIDADHDPDEVEASIWRAIQGRLPQLAAASRDAVAHGS